MLKTLQFSIGNRYAHIGLFFDGNAEGGCLNANCKDEDFHWIDGSAWSYTTEIFNEVAVNENATYIIMGNAVGNNNLHDTPGFDPRFAACQVDCKMR